MLRRDNAALLKRNLAAMSMLESLQRGLGSGDALHGPSLSPIRGSPQPTRRGGPQIHRPARNIIKHIGLLHATFPPSHVLLPDIFTTLAFPQLHDHFLTFDGRNFWCQPYFHAPVHFW